LTQPTNREAYGLALTTARKGRLMKALHRILRESVGNLELEGYASIRSFLIRRMLPGCG